MTTTTDDVPIGIDLGTTNSGIAYLHKGYPEIVRTDRGSRTIPSVVAFTEKGFVVGEEALDQMGNDPANTVFEIKRLIGGSMRDSTVQSDVKLWPFLVQDDGKGNPQLRVQHCGSDKVFYPERIAAMILTKLKNMAEKHLGRAVKTVVVTVPAAFTDAQRKATIAAAEMASLEIQRIINEPTAAAIAYGHLNELSKVEKKKVVVLDLGGGTFDVSILEMKEGEYEVLQTLGDAHLGGGDFDSRIMDFFQKDLINKYGERANLVNHPRETWRLRRACEEAKKLLSVGTLAAVRQDDLLNGIDCNGEVTRAKFEELCLDLFERIKDITTRCLKSAGLTPSDIHDVVLVGGSSRIPKVKEIAVDLFGESKVRQSVNPDEAVTQGAVLQAAILSNFPSITCTDLVLKDILSHSLGINVLGEKTSHILRRNQILPITNTQTYETSSDNQTTIEIRVMEGEDNLTKNNDILDVFSILDLPPKLAGEEKVLVTFTVDENGVFDVKVQSVSTGKSIPRRVNRKGKQITEEEKQRHRDFESHNCKQMAEDAEIDELRSNLERLLTETRKQSVHEEMCDHVTGWMNRTQNATKDQLREHIQSLEGINIARNVAHDALVNRLSTLRSLDHMHTVYDDVTNWMEKVSPYASEQDYLAKVAFLDVVNPPDPMQSRLEKKLADCMTLFSQFDELMAKCKDIQNWLNSKMERGSKDDDSFSSKIDELDEVLHNCFLRQLASPYRKD